jgi:hypothetical protein
VLPTLCASAVRPSISQTLRFRLSVSARVSSIFCCCVRASVLKEFLVLRASVLQDFACVTFFPPFQEDEGYGTVMVCQHYRQNCVLFDLCCLIQSMGCPDASVRNYQNSLRNNPEDRSSHALRGGSLKLTGNVIATCAGVHNTQLCVSLCEMS